MDSARAGRRGRRAADPPYNSLCAIGGFLLFQRVRPASSMAPAIAFRALDFQLATARRHPTESEAGFRAPYCRPVLVHPIFRPRQCVDQGIDIRDRNGRPPLLHKYPLSQPSGNYA